MEHAVFFLVLVVLTILGDGKQAVGDVVAAAGILSLFVLRATNARPMAPISRRLEWSWLVVLLYFATRTVFSDSVGYSISLTVRWIMGYLVFVFFSSMIPTKKRETTFSSLLLLFGIFVVFASIIASAIEPLGRSLVQMNLLYPSSGHNHVVNIIVFVLPLALSRLIERKDKISAGITIFLGGALALSFARGAWVLVGFYFLYLLITNRIAQARTKLVLVGIAAVIMGMFIFGLTVKTLPKNVFQRQLFTRQIVKESFVESRLPYWKQAIAAFEERPWFGAGPGTFNILSKRFQENQSSYSWFTHSLPLELVAELGLVGLGLVILLGFVLWRDIRRHPGRDYWLSHSIVLTVSYSAYEMNLNFLVVWFLLWATLGVLTSNKSVNKFRTKSKYFLGVSMGILTVFYVSSAGAMLLGLFSINKLYAFYLEPYSVNRAIRILVDTKPLTPRIFEIIKRLHARDPEVLAALAEASESVTQSSMYYWSAESLDPKNQELKKQHLRFLMNKGRYQEVFDALWTYTKPVLKNDASTEAPEYKDSAINATNKNDLLMVFESQWSELLLAKAYYLMGVNIVSQDQLAADQYFAISEQLAPMWDYFYIERAALAYYVDHDWQKAKMMLRSCQEHKKIYDYCNNLEKNLKQLHQPGYLKENILSMF